MKLDIQPLNPQPVKLDIQPLDIQPLQQGVESDPDFLEQLKVAVKQGLVAPEDLLNRAASGIAGGLANLVGKTDARDKIFNQMEQDLESNRQWANPDNIKPGVGASVLGSIPSIPGQMVTLPLHMLETGQDMVKRGEGLGRSYAGMGITGASDAAGAILGPMGKAVPTKLITGAAANVAQTIAQKKALQAISSTEEGKKAYEISPEELAVAGLTGAGFGAIHAYKDYKTPSVNKSKVPTAKDIVAQAKAIRDNTSRVDIPVEGNEPQPVIRVGKDGEAYVSTPENEFARQAAEQRMLRENDQQYADPMNRMVRELSPTEEPKAPVTTVDPFEQIKEQALREGDRARYEQAQAAIDARQKQMEFEVARQANLERQATERTKQEQAPTGYSEWVDNLRNSAEQRVPGNNAPLNMENPYPVDINQFPQVLKDAPTPQEQGLHFDTAINEKVLPLEIQDMLGTGKTPDPFDRYSPNQAARRILIEGETPNIIKSSPTGPRINKFGQGGQAPIIQDIVNATANGIRKLTDFINKQTEGELPPSDLSIDYLDKMGVYNSKLYPGEDAQSVIAKTHTVIEKANALGQSTDSNLWKNVQAGPVLAGEKIKGSAPWVHAAGRWMAWTTHATDYAHKTFIQPLERTYNSLSKEQLNMFASLMKEMQLARTELSTDDLAKQGVDNKVLKAIEQYRQEDVRALNAVNASRRALGKPEITPAEAHFHSHFQGDYQIFVRDKSGTMLWPVHTRSRAEANQAMAWLKENFKDNPEVDTSSINVKFAPNRTPVGKQMDMLSTLGDFKKMFPEGSEGSDLVQQVMQKYLDQQGNNALGQNLMQEKGKANMRGFEGDKPWKDEHQNARDYVKASTQNMLDQHRWAAQQQMINQVKQMVTDPIIAKEQPNNVGLVKAHLMKSLGISDNIWKEAQARLADAMPSGHMTSTSLNSIVRGLKAIGYGTTLGFSAGYAIATPFQAVAGSMGNIVRSLNLGEIKPEHIPDMLGGVLHGMYAGLTGAKPFTAWSKDALAYAKDNGIATNILLDNDQNIGGNKAIGHLSSLVNFTISRPDQVCRLPIFMAFASAMEKSGKFATKEQAFQRAGEVTENIMISMKNMDRPLWIDKMGPIGEAAYMFKAPVVNLYNTLALGAHDIANAKGAEAKMRAAMFPLTYLATAAFIGGIHSLPGVEELESGLDAFKALTAEHFPTFFEKNKDNWMLSPKEVALTTFPASTWYGEILNYGAASSMTGLGLTSRFGGGVLNVEDPLNAISPLAQEFKEWGSAAGALMHPNSATISNAVREQIPNGLRGLYELNNPMYTVQKDGEGNRLMLNPKSLIGEPRGDYRYTPDEQKLKAFGLKSLDEQKWRTENALATKQKMNYDAAAQASLKKISNAIYRNNSEDAAAYAQAYVRLTGNGDAIRQQIVDAIPKQYTDKEQYLRMHPASLSALMAIQKLEEMRK